MENKSEQNSKKNSNVIYFLIVVVVALLGTDVYLYLQKKKDVAKIVYQSEDEKHRLQTELDSLEAQIEQVNTGKAKLSAEMQARTDSLQAKIVVLKRALAKGQLSVNELKKAQEDIKQLRYFVTKYTADIEELRQQNESLTTERDTLKHQVATVSQKATTLEQQNQELSSKVKVASALKMGAAEVVAYKVKSSGKEVDVNRAGPAKKIKVNFTIASNPVAEKTMHDIFMRVIDPAGNLLVMSDSGVFTADGQELQYTYKTSIDYKDDGTTYTIDWTNPNKFVKGTYTVLLYSDGATMGKTEFKLK